jgi:hypothetical protein
MIFFTITITEVANTIKTNITQPPMNNNNFVHGEPNKMKLNSKV